MRGSRLSGMHRTAWEAEAEEAWLSRRREGSRRGHEAWPRLLPRE